MDNSEVHDQAQQDDGLIFDLLENHTDSISSSYWSARLTKNTKVVAPSSSKQKKARTALPAKNTGSEPECSSNKNISDQLINDLNQFYSQQRSAHEETLLDKVNAFLDEISLLEAILSGMSPVLIVQCMHNVSDHDGFFQQIVDRVRHRPHFHVHRLPAFNGQSLPSVLNELLQLEECSKQPLEHVEMSPTNKPKKSKKRAQNKNENGGPNVQSNSTSKRRYQLVQIDDCDSWPTDHLNMLIGECARRGFALVLGCRMNVTDLLSCHTLARLNPRFLTLTALSHTDILLRLLLPDSTQRPVLSLPLRLSAAVFKFMLSRFRDCTGSMDDCLNVWRVCIIQHMRSPNTPSLKFVFELKLRKGKPPYHYNDMVLTEEKLKAALFSELEEIHGYHLCFPVALRVTHKFMLQYDELVAPKYDLLSFYESVLYEDGFNDFWRRQSRLWSSWTLQQMQERLHFLQNTFHQAITVAQPEFTETNQKLHEHLKSVRALIEQEKDAENNQEKPVVRARACNNKQSWQDVKNTLKQDMNQTQSDNPSAQLRNRVRSWWLKQCKMYLAPFETHTGHELMQMQYSPALRLLFNAPCTQAIHSAVFNTQQYMAGMQGLIESDGVVQDTVLALRVLCSLSAQSQNKGMCKTRTLTLQQWQTQWMLCQTDNKHKLSDLEHIGCVRMTANKRVPSVQLLYVPPPTAALDDGRGQGALLALNITDSADDSVGD